ncbi:unnamed protein product [marine sediment metagenome]|uniref:Uncharacterized protein n=1 Tax=marine sediment metagenome TaxID=412755 RepID=X0Y1M0_9ZZZZ
MPRRRRRLLPPENAATLTLSRFARDKRPSPWKGEGGGRQADRKEITGTLSEDM